MPAILSAAPGRVVKLQTRQQIDTPFEVRMSNWGQYESQKAIITSVSLAMQGNYQFLTTVADFIYVYVFGEKIAQMQVSGAAFMTACNTRGATGLEAAITYYNNNRIAARGRPILINFGLTKTFSGFLTAGTVSIANAEFQIGQFNWTFHIFPGSAR